MKRRPGMYRRPLEVALILGMALAFWLGIYLMARLGAEHAQPDPEPATSDVLLPPATAER